MHKTVSYGYNIYLHNQNKGVILIGQKRLRLSNSPILTDVQPALRAVCNSISNSRQEVCGYSVR